MIQTALEMSGPKYYITPAGASRLRAELNHLYRVERPEITQKVADAAALGDRSENADYIYGKRRLREIDRRIRYLTKRIDNLEIVDRKPPDRDKVFFGAWVRTEDEQGVVSVVRIVGSDEFDLKKGWISMDSPVAKGLLGKTVGDEVELHRPKGREYVVIDAVSYEPMDDLT